MGCLVEGYKKYSWIGLVEQRNWRFVCYTTENTIDH